MVDTRTRNNMNTASGPLTSESVSAVAHSDYRNGLMLDVDSITSIWQHPPQMPVVSVKQEPVAIEQGSHSPNNDSGISPGHGSSGSSAGRPSPGQSGSFGSPEHFSVQENRGMKSEPNTESDASSQLPSNQQPTSQNTAPVWGINLLQHSHSQCIVPSSLQAANNPNLGNSILKSASQTPMPEPEHPHQQQTKSPSSETHITENRTPSTSPLHSLNSLVIPMANRNHAVNQSMVSPNHCVQSPICDSPVRISSQNNMKTPPMHVKNATPGLNPGFSDDNNSRSSSTSSSTLTLDGGNENFKMTLHEGEQSPLRCLEMTVEQSSVMGGMRAGVASGPGVGNSGVRNVYQCPLCDYTTPSRTDFNDHNRTHCPDQKCSKCDFVTKDIAELEAHLCEHHMLSPGLAEQIIEANEEQPGIRVPRVNSQGKMKTFRCKQCSFVALTKMQFWNHSRCHIKREKMLNCPRCPFVTEYKHHLEYHLRNHANSKPFQCPDCSYSCVNKSMLNSHLKSHSNVCQYRCATCDYATKYLHSLKVHLRKYGHTPAMVLNPDGTPNPDPIIDVYGTRRGPKQRPRNIVKSSSKEKNNDASFPSHAPLSLSPFQPSYGVIPQQSGNLPIPYPYGCIMSNPFSANINSNSLLPKFPQSSSISIQDKSNTIPDSRRNSSNENYDHFLAASSEYYHMNNNTNNNNNNIVSNSNALKEIDTKKSIQKQNSIETSKLGTGEHALFLNNKTVDGDPLDLSKPDAMDICSEASVTYATPSILHKSASVKTSKHRRKGQAYKLDHISRKLQQQTSLSDIEGANRKYSHVPESEENPLSPEKTDNLTNTQPTHHENVHDNQHPESEMRKMKEELPRVEAQNRNSHENNTSSASKPEVYCCDHCDITFSDVILYSMHKGYHGYQDPFKCNMCGVQTANKVEFFLHIARSSHS